MRRMEKITGRSDDMIILRGVNLFPTQIEELILRTTELSPHFQCVLAPRRTAGRADRTGRAARRTAIRPRRRAAGATLAATVKNTIGVSSAVEVVGTGRDRTVGRQDAPDRRRTRPG